ncbi:Rha family transcriptional regulator [Pseudomonas syringae]|uniref:Rha family transcriptional regulator n=1 Tax=Pseudomonas syringae TaxID=317 RepID=UPI003D801F45
MGSLEIAKLTGKRHDSVIRDIRNMLNELESDLHSFEEVYRDQGGRTYPCFKLDRHHTECLLTGYSAKMRMAVIKRWHELEEVQHMGEMGFCHSAQSQGAIIESLSGLQTEVKILKEMIRSIIAGPGVVREVVVKSPYEGTTKGTVSYHADAALIREIGDTMH